MRFPHADRVVYGRTSLVEVICQLKFPPILRIDEERPSAVQEKLRADLPMYEKTDLGQVTSGLLFAGGQPMVVPPQLADQRSEHAFIAADRRTRVTLGRDFVALSTLAYERWEAFEKILAATLDAVEATYTPHSYTRVGLRYQNVIARGPLGLTSLPWGDLLDPRLLGMLAASEDLRPKAATREDVFDIDAAEKVATARIVHGLVEQDGELSYLIDSDFFVEGSLTRASSIAALDGLHEQSRNFFRFCVLTPLHDAMLPKEI